QCSLAYRYLPSVPTRRSSDLGTATIQTCGAGTTFDTVLYLRSGACASGSEVAAGCNDDACANATGLYRASRLTPTVTGGAIQTGDRKSTRLNSSHQIISYAVF